MNVGPYSNVSDYDSDENDNINLDNVEPTEPEPKSKHREHFSRRKFYPKKKEKDILFPIKEEVPKVRYYEDFHSDMQT